MMIRQKMYIKFALKRVQWIDYLKQVIKLRHKFTERNILIKLLKPLARTHTIRLPLSNLGHYIMNGDIGSIALLEQLKLVNVQFSHNNLDAMATGLSNKYIKHITKDKEIVQRATSKVELLKFILDSKAYHQFTDSFSYMKHVIDDDIFHSKPKVQDRSIRPNVGTSSGDAMEIRANLPEAPF